MMGVMLRPRHHPHPHRDGLIVVAALRLEARCVGGSVVRCGMGGPRAASCGLELARNLAPAVPVAVVGVCGAVAPDLAPGTVVVADDVSVPGSAPTALRHGPALARILATGGVPVRGGHLVTVPRLVRGRQRQSLADAGADAVDMESEPLVRALAGHPVVVVRAVADTPGSGMVLGGLKALAALRRIRPALESWAAAIGQSPGAGTEPDRTAL